MDSNKLAGLGLFSATMIVVANIIGAGIFMTPGEIVQGMPSASGLLLVFAGGGVLAVCGALCYGELASAIPRSGGEYQYLSTLYHPALGFISGFISLVAGFAAPIAMSANGFGTYLGKLLPLVSQPSSVELFEGFSLHWNNSVAYGSILILALSVLHSLTLHAGAKTQNVFTVLKAGLILLFIFAGLFTAAHVDAPLAWTEADSNAITFGAFGGGLVAVYYTYSGWNAAVYLSGEIRDPERNVPRALLFGTLIVIALFLSINYVFVRHVPVSAMSGKIEVGALAAESIFGSKGGQLVTSLIALALISSVSSMIMAGPRVAEAIGRDFQWFAQLSKPNSHGVPVFAIVLQSLLALIILASASFFTILIYVGFMLTTFAMLSVLGVFIIRYRKMGKEGGYRTWGYPFTPALFVLICLYVISTAAYNPHGETWLQKFSAPITGTITVGLGLGIYILTSRSKKA